MNPAYSRHGSETESNSSDMDNNRDISPPRVRRPRGGRDNQAFSSDSSYEDSSSVDDEKVDGTFTAEDETNEKDRRKSFPRAKENDLLDGHRSDRSIRANGPYTRTGEGQERRSRRDDYKPRKPRSDSPLAIETLEEHEKITSGKSDRRNDTSKRDTKKDKSKRWDPSPSVDSSVTQTGSLVTEGTQFTATTMSSGRLFDPNPNLRRISPSRSSSLGRCKAKKDSLGRTRRLRTHSGERRSRSGDRRERSRSPGSSRSGSSPHSRRSPSRREAKVVNKQQEMLPIFKDPKATKS